MFGDYTKEREETHSAGELREETRETSPELYVLDLARFLLNQAKQGEAARCRESVRLQSIESVCLATVSRLMRRSRRITRVRK